MSAGELIGAVELGGTKVLVAIATDPLKPLRTVRIPTEDPQTTLGRVCDFFRAAESEFGPVRALGIGAFGPIQLRKGAPDLGRIARTPKPGWAGTDLLRALEKVSPATLDTDVNAAALGEARWGAGRDVEAMVYLTVGTGIGGGVVADGRTLKGVQHPEIGHIRIVQHLDDTYRSRCPYHPDCAEGLASGPAIMDRFGVSLDRLPPAHPFHAMLADYLAQVCATLVLVVSPGRIVIGGGVMGGATLHAQVEQRMRNWLNHYVEPGGGAGGPFVVPPALGDHAGLAGCFALALDGLGKH